MAVLVAFNDNWADEMDVEGFHIYKSKEEFDKELKEEILDYAGIEDEEYENFISGDDFWYTYGIGSNESLEYESFKDLYNKFSITEISNEEYEILNKYFGCSYGQFPF